MLQVQYVEVQGAEEYIAFVMKQKMGRPPPKGPHYHKKKRVAVPGAHEFDVADVAVQHSINVNTKGPIELARESLVSRAGYCDFLNMATRYASAKYRTRKALKTRGRGKKKERHALPLEALAILGIADSQRHAFLIPVTPLAYAFCFHRQGPGHIPVAAGRIPRTKSKRLHMQTFSRCSGRWRIHLQAV